MTEALTAIIRFSSMRSVPDVYGPDMILKSKFRQGDGCGRHGL